ncbi:response regulator transcription factor [Chitinophaga rhizosphaerae]|uniref:response regulator transcription factor n=1 Tax=Chitinophaga rhizosphaerae TaxID=1864947 RepID=UPI000F8118D3|nr:response regulator transcription factor [Chitinophaga rhizosphaerae]
MHKVLVVEDDPNIVELLRMHLTDLGCEVNDARNGFDAMEKIHQTKFQLIVLDIMLPGINGMEICRLVRQKDRETPIIFLTSKSEEIDKVLGLETGADDYLTKPFSIREFLARVKVIFRRNELPKDAGTGLQSGAVLRFGELEVDVDMRKVTLGKLRIELSPREFDLLVLLASNPGKSYSRQRLLNLVWGYDFDGYEHTVNSHINRLRSKIEPDIAEPRYILTTWGVGYRFNEEM